MKNLRQSTTTIPENNCNDIDYDVVFRRAIADVFIAHNRYDMEPGSTLEIKVPRDRVWDIGTLCFVMIPGTCPESDFLTVCFNTIVISAFWLLPSNAPDSQAVTRYFCGTQKDLVREKLDTSLDEEVIVGRLKPIFCSLVGLHTISKVHARICSFPDPKYYVMKIADGSREKPSSYGSTILTCPDTTIYHTGEVRTKRHFEDQLIALR